jgi:phytoene dehydrogenase-like protein
MIRAGIVGLTAAAYLADAGLKVAVFERNVLAGGYCYNYSRKVRHEGKPVVYRFDAGPHDFSGVWPGGPVTGMLKRLRIAGPLRWERIDHRYCLAACRAEAFRLISGEVLPARTFIGLLMVSRTGCNSV